MPAEAAAPRRTPRLAAALAAAIGALGAASPAPSPRAAPPASALSDPRAVVLDVSGHVVEGAPRAPLTLVEFSDYDCVYCARHHRETWPRLAEAFVRTGKLRRVFFDLPIRSIHPFAFRAARAARCAGEQGRYLEMQDALFAGTRGVNEWASHAKAAGLEVEPFLACLNSSRHVEEVRRDMTAAGMAGIEEVPVFLIARTDPIDPASVTGIAFVVGAAPYERFESEIRRALEAAAQEAKP